MSLFVTERAFFFQSPLDLLFILLWASLLETAPVWGQSAAQKPEISFCLHGPPSSKGNKYSEMQDDLILWAPYPVFEGDSLVLHCLAKEETKLTEVTYYKDGTALVRFEKYSNYSIPKAKLSNSGQYHCSAKKFLLKFIAWGIKAKPVTIQVQELFPLPILRSTTLEPLEETAVTLSCETQLPPKKANIQLHFSFFRNDRVISSGQERAPKLQLPRVQREDSGSYFCEAETVTSGVRKRSHPVWIRVQRVPVFGVHLEIKPPGGQLTEGQTLVLLCSVAGGTGDITFSWHKVGTETVLKKKTQRSLVAEFEIFSVRENEAGKYYCTADNTNKMLHSKPVSISVKIPVSPPLLTFSTPETQTFVGKVMELCCKAQRGSGPILYRFYHEGKIIKNSSAPFGGAASFNLSLTEQHAGNYYCEADNGIAVQFSKVLTLSVKVPVSHPLLILSAPKPQATAGDMVEFRCEAKKGTTPILYRFFRQNTILKTGWAFLGEAAFLNLSLTAEDSGTYSCEADNGFGPQLSEGVKLSVTVPAGKQRSLLAGGVSVGLLSFLGLIGVAFLLYFRTRRRTGESFAPGFYGYPPITGSQEPTQIELEPTYVNDPDQQSRMHNPIFAVQGLPLNPVDSDVVYSEVQSQEQKVEDADDHIWRLPPTQDLSVVYSEVKGAQLLEERDVMKATDRMQDHDIDNYENIKLHS